MAVPAERVGAKLDCDELLAEYVQAYRPVVERLCRILLRHSGEAEDATQQTFLLAYQSLLAGTRPHNPRAWLFTIARRECWARASRQRHEQPVAETEAGCELDPAERTVLRAELATISAGLEQLPARQKQAIVLRELAGFSYTQLAAALEVSESAAEALLVRARRTLRESRLVLVLLSFPGSLRRLLHLGGGHARAAVGMQAAKAVAVAALVTGTVAVAGAEVQAEPTAHPSAPAAVRTTPAEPAVARTARPVAKPSQPVRRVDPLRTARSPARPVAAARVRREIPAAPAQREPASPAASATATAATAPVRPAEPAAAPGPQARLHAPAPRPKTKPRKPSPPPRHPAPSTPAPPGTTAPGPDQPAPPPPTTDTPPSTDPPPDASSGSSGSGDTRPGNGYGDDNHDHTGKR